MRKPRRLKRSQVNSPKYWREMAKTAREGAEKAPDGSAKSMMLGFAQGYAELAKVIERRIADK